MKSGIRIPRVASRAHSVRCRSTPLYPQHVERLLRRSEELETWARDAVLEAHDLSKREGNTSVNTIMAWATAEELLSMAQEARLRLYDAQKESQDMEFEWNQDDDTHGDVY